eukprot:336442-Chlamydomonas_euryale.AAC.2
MPCMGVRHCQPCSDPGGWKSALITPLYKSKGPGDAAESYQGISLLPIAGKVFAALLLHSTAKQTKPTFHEAQNE